MHPDGRDDPARPDERRTWRKAAWLAVGASTVAVLVLVVAAARIAGPESPFQRIDAFPGLPTGGLLTARPPATPTTQQPQPSTTPGAAGTAVPSSQPIAGVERSDGQGPLSHPGPVDGPGRPTRTTAPTPSGFDTGEPSSPPSVSVLPSTGVPLVTAADLIAATTQFYDALPGDPQSAWNLLGTKLREEGFDNFRRQWTNVAAVKAMQLVVNSDASSVLATVRMVTVNGGDFVRNFELVFGRESGVLVIDDIRPVGDTGNEPAR